MDPASKALWEDNTPTALAQHAAKQQQQQQQQASRPASSAAPPASVLHEARMGHHDEVLELLRGGKEVDVNEEHDGSTPALVAAYRGWEDVMLLLVERGVDFNVKTQLGETPLMRALRSGKFSVDTIDKMLAAGARKSLNVATEPTAFFPGWTALHFAADANLNPNPGVIAVLIKHGANVNAKDREGRTPADIAANFEAQNPGKGFDYVNAFTRKSGSILSQFSRPSTTESERSGPATSRGLVRNSSLQDFARSLFGAHAHHSTSGGDLDRDDGHGGGGGGAGAVNAGTGRTSPRSVSGA